MSEVGLVFACAGCCCGHPERGGPKPAPRMLKAAVRLVHRLSGVAGQVRLSFTDPSGPAARRTWCSFTCTDVRGGSVG
jgi:hypothetical protein